VRAKDVYLGKEARMTLTFFSEIFFFVVMAEARIAFRLATLEREVRNDISNNQHSIMI
jgi:hypothetical protein